MSLISVITICYNNPQDLASTCSSVDQQDLKPHEHIIINGSSTADIKVMLEQTDQPGYRKWLNEADKGIADAFNKGIAYATGDIVVMLNAGDEFYESSVLTKVTDTFKKYHTITWLHGTYKLLRADKWVIIGKPFEKSKLYRGMRSICHQTMFVKRELHTRYGLYDTREKISMDYDFVCRIANEPFVFLNTPLVNYAPSGTSSVNYLQSLKDARRIYEKYYGKTAKIWLWQLRLKTLHFLLKSPAGAFLYKIKTALKLENM